jgi:hypothetical protein
MRYQVTLSCPRCGKTSETFGDTATPNLKCGDCLMDHVEIVHLVITGAWPVADQDDSRPGKAGQ